MTRKILAILLSAMLIMAICPFALAEGEGEAPSVPATTEAKDVSVSVGSPIVGASTVYIPVSITNNGAEDITLDTIVRAKGTALPEKMTADGITIPAYSSADTLLSPSFSKSTPGTYVDTVTFSFNGGKIEKSCNVVLTVEQQQISTDEKTETGAAFKLSSFDPNGLIVPTTSGKSGDRVIVRLPLVCIDGPVMNVTATPVMSTSLEEFPFEIEQVDYTAGYNGFIGTSQILEFQFDLRFAKKATAGIKKVDFLVTYERAWGDTPSEKQSCTISLFVNITKGYEGTDGSDGGETTQALPKLVVDGYEFSSEKIYAGDEFTLSFTVRNTSSEEDTESILITMTNNAETGKLTPANGSNTVYIDKLAKGESKTVSMDIATAPDTEAKAYELNLAFDYEGSKTRPATMAKGESSAAIPVTIMQKIRLKFEDPTVDGEPLEGESVPIYFSMYNMGRSPIYNCMITVEGDGLSMEESFFQGTVTAGSTMRADFSIITATAGQIEGEIVITYEDSLEEQMEERLPLSLYVTEAYDPSMDDFGDAGYYEPTVGDYDDPSASSGIPTWLIIVLCAVVAAAIVVTIILLKKKRAKELEDI